MEENKIKIGLENLFTGEIEEIISETSESEETKISFEPLPAHVQYPVLKESERTGIPPEAIVAMLGSDHPLITGKE